MNRRSLLKSALLGVSALVLRPSWAIASGSDDANERLAELERRHGGRLGVAILDTGNGHRATHRGDERFLMCSTFKLLAVAAVLARVDRGDEHLDRRIVFGREVLLSYAPMTSQHVGSPGMSIAELCAAAMTVSDNTAANLLLASMGGPGAVTRFARSLGDTVTRLDRIEPDLNIASPGDIRDTTTPNAALATLQNLLLGNALAAAPRAQLIEWLRGCTTGAEKLRAGLPPGWTIGDKTGSGAQNETNDVGILYPPQRQPLLVTAYYAGSAADAATRNAVLADVGRIAAQL
ncbi:beta-lactamase class A [Rhodanobacter sp. ANJX3]|uniref:class A beta-lactamase n=1 Tax=unclassified Rhodanobacter TaxID=2621553 RepID=UPI0015CB4CD3|nr:MULTISPECIES: class A beta-lactamase [unclassified Rhodanobacter]MBB5357598.1 beta-lactamase class A [Rhodanobacter sp. ANJX3]NYE27590.1 beta-lactamase class A [Rhodanobacter sp. K2T2]